MNINLTFNNGIKLLCGAVFLCVSALEGNAAVFRNDVSPSLYKEFQAQHQEIANKVCRVSYIDKDGASCAGSAVYLGSQKDSNKHYFVTAAHVLSTALNYHVSSKDAPSIDKMMAFVFCPHADQDATYRVEKVHYHPGFIPDCSFRTCPDPFRNIDVAVFEISAENFRLSPVHISFDQPATDPSFQKPRIHVGWGWKGSNTKGHIDPNEAMLKYLEPSPRVIDSLSIVEKLEKKLGKADSTHSFSLTQKEENALVHVLNLFEAYLPPLQVCQLPVGSSDIQALYAAGMKKEKEYLENRYIQAALPLPEGFTKSWFAQKKRPDYRNQFAVDSTVPPLACNPTFGDSGGAIFNDKGYLLGIYTRGDFTGSQETVESTPKGWRILLSERIGFQPIADFLAPYLPSVEEKKLDNDDL